MYGACLRSVRAFSAAGPWDSMDRGYGAGRGLTTTDKHHTTQATVLTVQPRTRFSARAVT